MCVHLCRHPHGGVHACSAVSDCANPWTIACQAPLSMGFSRQEHWMGLLQGIFLTQVSNQYLLSLLHWQTGSFTTEPPGNPTCICSKSCLPPHLTDSPLTLCFRTSKKMMKPTNQLRAPPAHWDQLPQEEPQCSPCLEGVPRNFGYHKVSLGGDF